MDMGAGRYVLMAHLMQGSVTGPSGGPGVVWPATRRGREQRSFERALHLHLLRHLQVKGAVALGFNGPPVLFCANLRFLV